MSLAALLAAALLGVITTLAPPAMAAAEAACPLAWGVALDGFPITSRHLAQAKAATVIPPRMVVFFLQWPAPGGTGEMPVASLEAIRAAGALPVLTWEPMYLDAQGEERAIPAAGILAGEYDAYLAALAKAVAQWGGPVVVRLAHEMNLERYHWGSDKAGYGPQSPELYRRIHRHVVDLCRGQGASNMRWAFCPNAESLPHPQWHGAAWNTATAYWPGAEYVDVLGMDGYNWGTSQTKEKHGWQSRWQSFGQIFGPLRDELMALAPDKPLVVFETSCALAGGQRASWLEEALKLCKAWGVRGLGWFQAKKEVDWRLTAERDTQALEQLSRATACPPGGALSGPWPAQSPDKDLR